MSGLNLVFIGLSLSSSWGNGHATTYRALLRALARRGHDITFLERNTPWYAHHRDLPTPEFCRLHLYDSVQQLRDEHAATIAEADAVVVGSYVPQGVDVARMVFETNSAVRAFYDIDTPVTIAKLRRGDFEYLHPDLIRQFDLYCSFSGGRALQILEHDYGSPFARALYCSVDPELYSPHAAHNDPKWTLGYLGAYSDDRQPSLSALLLRVASARPQERFVVAGAQYPGTIEWPENVDRIDHVAPADHAGFYGAQRATLNITRRDMRHLGHSPSVRLFEAAACGVPIISDRWNGIEELFVPEEEIILVDSTADVLRALCDRTPDDLKVIASRGRRRILNEHTAEHRAAEFEKHLKDAASLRCGATAMST